MKKITFLLFLLLASLTSQATNIIEVGTKLYPGSAINSTEVSSGYYLIKSKSDTYSSTPYLVANGTSLNLAADPDLGNTNVGLWKIAFKASATDGDTQSSEYYILNVSTNTYFTQGPSVPLGSTKYVCWINHTAENTYQIGLSNSNSGLNWSAIGATSTTSFSRTDTNREQDFELIPVNFFETPASVAAATKWYRIQGKKSGYVNYNASGTLSLSSTVTEDDLWCFVPQTDGSYKIYSKADQTKTWGAFDVSTNNTSGSISLTEHDNTTASATSFFILPTYADYPYMGFRINTNVSSTAYINQISGTSLGSWNSSQAIYGWGKNNGDNITGNGDDGSGFQFIEVAIVDEVKYTIASNITDSDVVTYNSTDYQDGATFTSTTVLSASNFTAKTQEGYLAGKITITPKEGEESSFIVNVNYIANPITATTITDGKFAESTQWYRLVINRSTKLYSRFNKENNNTDNSTNQQTDCSSFFCFVRDNAVTDGYKIYNLAGGTTQAITCTGSPDTNRTDEVCSYSTEGTTFVIEHNNTAVANGFQFRVNGKDNAYCNDVQNHIGVWYHTNASTDVGGTFLIEEGNIPTEIITNYKTSLVNSINDLGTSNIIGTGLGQYAAATDDYTTALNTANAIKTSSDINDLPAIEEATNNLQAAISTLTINLPQTGKYYRMRVKSQDAAATNYLSAYGNDSYLNTKVSESEAPTIFKLTSDNKLQAVYNDRYIKSSSSNYEHLVTTASADEAETWTIAGSTTTPGTYTLKAGETDFYLYDWTTYSRDNTLVANEPNGNRCQWTIEEVTLDEDLIKAFDLSLISPAQYQPVNAIEPIPNAEIIYPNEYNYTPAELYASLNAVKTASTENTLSEIKKVLNSDLVRVKHYNQLCTDNGTALGAECTLKGRYATLILPINFSCPANWKRYICNNVNGDQLELTEFTQEMELANNGTKNIPFIVEYTDDESMPSSDSQKKYQFIGYSNGAATENQTMGCLTGVLENDTHIPDNSYVFALEKKTGRQAFFKTDGTVVCPLYKCYFTAPTPSASITAFYFDNNGQSTGIEGIFGGNNEETVIYNISGQRISKLQKGVNIVNGRKVLVK